MILVKDVMDSASALLNDYSKEIFTYEVQLPFIRIALKDLVADLELNESSYVEEIVRLTVPAANKALTSQSIPPIPPDFRFPIDLAERVAGNTQQPFMDMYEREWDTDKTNSTHRVYWNFREGEVKFPEATQATEIEMRYVKDPPAVMSENSLITYNGADSVLHYKLASILSRYVGSNEMRANSLNAYYLDYLRKYLATGVKQRHAYPISRPGFRSGRRS